MVSFDECEANDNNCLSWGNISSRFPSNSEELLGNLEGMFPRYLYDSGWWISDYRICHPNPRLSLKGCLEQLSMRFATGHMYNSVHRDQTGMAIHTHEKMLQ